MVRLLTINVLPSMLIPDMALYIGFLATGSLAQCTRVFEKLRTPSSSVAKLACAPFSFQLLWVIILDIKIQ
jgi:hypothetical protein